MEREKKRWLSSVLSYFACFLFRESTVIKWGAIGGIFTRIPMLFRFFAKIDNATLDVCLSTSISVLLHVSAGVVIALAFENPNRDPKRAFWTGAIGAFFVGLTVTAVRAGRI